MQVLWQFLFIVVESWLEPRSQRTSILHTGHVTRSWISISKWSASSSQAGRRKKINLALVALAAVCCQMGIFLSYASVRRLNSFSLRFLVSLCLLSPFLFVCVCLSDGLSSCHFVCLPPLSVSVSLTPPSPSSAPISLPLLISVCLSIHSCVQGKNWGSKTHSVFIWFSRQ